MQPFWAYVLRNGNSIKIVLELFTGHLPPIQIFAIKQTPGVIELIGRLSPPKEILRIR
jgi:hypothetical protein